MQSFHAAAAWFPAARFESSSLAKDRTGTCTSCSTTSRRTRRYRSSGGSFATRASRFTSSRTTAPGSTSSSAGSRANREMDQRGSHRSVRDLVASIGAWITNWKSRSSCTRRPRSSTASRPTASESTTQDTSSWARGQLQPGRKITLTDSRMPAGRSCRFPFAAGLCG